MGNACASSPANCATGGGGGSTQQRRRAEAPSARLLPFSHHRSNDAAFQSQEVFASTTGNNEGRNQSSTIGENDVAPLPALNTTTPANVRSSPTGAAVMAGALDVSELQMSTTHFNEVDSVKTVLSRGSWGSSRIPEDSNTDGIMFVVLGSFSARAIDRIFPSLLRLYETSLIDQKNSAFVAVGLEDCNDTKYHAFCEERLPHSSKKNEFMKKIRYLRADCTRAEDLKKLPHCVSGRILYFLSLPPSVKHESVMRAVNDAPNVNSWTRIVLLGADPQTYQVQQNKFLLGEERIFRVDPFAGSDAVRRLVALRFGNRVLEPTWNRNHVKAVLFDFCLDVVQSRQHSEETFLKSVFVDHLFSLIALVAMERPASRFGDDVRDAKADVLAAIQVTRADRLVLGSSTASSSKQPTFACVVFDIDTSRWRGVPFVCRVGRDMDRTRSEVRVLFRTAAGADALWKDQGMALKDNELTIRVVPGENATLDLVSNLPGLDTQLKTQRSTLDFLSQASPYVPEPFERLVYDAMRGRRANFVRKDALLDALRVIQPLLNPISKVHEYPANSHLGPEASDELIARTLGGAAHWTGREKQVLDEIWQRATDFSLAREMQLSLRLTFDQMRLLLRALTQEMEAGVSSREETAVVGSSSTIRMLETYVRKLPHGSEQGTFFALDMGGTNFRVVKFELIRNAPARKLHEASFRIPENCKIGTAQELFDFCAESIAQVYVQDEQDEAVFGFTFSFPTKQESLTQGRLITWTKGWTTSGVVGEDVSSLLQQALDRKGIKGRVAALINDTVGTLAAKCRDDPAVRVGVILGTGTNAAFVDPATNSVVNTEWGGFGSFGRVSALPVNHVDRAIDLESPNPGEQWFEKMISGYYLGEICRRWLVLMYEGKELWQGGAQPTAAGSPLYVPFAFDSKSISDIELDLSDGLESIRDIEEQFLGVTGSSLPDRILVRAVCRTVVERAARLTACAIAAVINRINKPGTVVAVDGSLFEAHASFKQRLIRALDSLGCHCSLVLSKDGSGLGAALVAAAATRKDDDVVATVVKKEA